MNGSVYRRAGGQWAYRFDAGAEPLTGKRVRRSKSGFATKKEAEKAMRDAISAHERGRSVRSNRMSMTEFLNEWHEAVRPGLRATTWVNYRDYIDAYVIPILGDTRLQDLTPLRLNRLYSHLLQGGRVRRPGGLAPKTVQNVHRMLHRALRDAVRWDLIPRNAAEDAQAPRVGKKKPQVWTPEQLSRFVSHVERDRFFAMWLLVATTGLRRGELAGLLRSDIDLEHGLVSPTVPRVVVAGYADASDPKTSSGERALALDPTTWSALADYIEKWEVERSLLGQNLQLLFVWPDGRPIHPDTITDKFHKNCAAAGLPRIRLHDVRHSYATAALKAGVSPKIISERLGHATVAFTLQTYAHVIPGMDRTAASEVASLILAGSSLAETLGHKFGHNGSENAPEKPLTWAKAQVSDSSGGRI